jgi:hypothetical protein
MIVNFLEPHSGGCGLIRYAESAAKAAAVIRPIHGDKHETFHLREQGLSFVE